MRRTWLAIGVCGLSIVMAAATPNCRRVVFDLGRKKLDHKPSPATQKKWDDYNKTHTPPTPKEILREIDLACPEVALEIPTLDALIPSDHNAAEWIAPDKGPTILETTATGSDSEDVDRRVASIEVPQAPMIPVQTPEPTSIFLLGTGLIGAAGLILKKRKL